MPSDIPAETPSSQKAKQTTLRRDPTAGGPLARRVGFAVLITALIPLVAALLLAWTIIARVSATAFQPEFGGHLDTALTVYADFARATKQSMRFEVDAIAENAALLRAARSDDAGTLLIELQHVFSQHPSLVSLVVEAEGGNVLGKQERPVAVDRALERTLTVRRPLGDAPEDEGPFLVAILATPNARFAEMDQMQSFVQAYHQLEVHHRSEYLDRSYMLAFASIFGLLIALSVVAGLVVARPVSRRIGELAQAMRPVAAGDLSVRVVVTGEDEVSDLGLAFNRMLEELLRSRARIEFLRRMSEWQQMARHLAHEIKNPLTPIQLAVQECHRRYAGDDEAYRRILQTTLEVVEEEVGTLRRLVGEFSGFARLPQAELSREDLGVFLREQRDHLKATQSDGGQSDEERLLSKVDLQFVIDEKPLWALLDREMLHRVLTNLIQNAAQALRDARGKSGKEPWGEVRVTAFQETNGFVVDIDDDGPGIAKDVRDILFDPYVTTKRDGTGLGLTIVKKIIVDHGGTIDAMESPLGGARFRIRLPTAEGRAGLG